MAEREHQYDKSSKWMIQRHGDALLRLAGVKGIASWRAVQAEVVQPRQLPDGLVSARLEGSDHEIDFIIEMATYQERRAQDQLVRDLLLAWLSRGALPEALVFVLRPKGRYRIPASRRLRSCLGLSQCDLRWKVIELWTIQADELLAMNEVGLVPWAPLCEHSQPPEELLLRCRRVIERQASPDERANLLAVTHVLARLRYNPKMTLRLLGGPSAMAQGTIISDLFPEDIARARSEGTRDALLILLETQFGEIPKTLRAKIAKIEDEKRLQELLRYAATSATLKEFRQRLAS